MNSVEDTTTHHEAYCLRCKSVCGLDNAEVQAEGARRVLVGTCRNCGGRCRKYQSKAHN